MLKIPRVYSDLHGYCSFCSGLLWIPANDQAQADWCQHMGARPGFLQALVAPMPCREGYLPKAVLGTDHQHQGRYPEGPVGL